MIRRSLSCCIWFAFGTGCAIAYDPVTHRALSLQAAASSVITDQDTRTRRGFPGPIDGSGAKKYRNSKGTTKTIINLIQDGAEFEDDTPRSMNHFFDPRTGSPLAINADDFISADDTLGFQTLLRVGVAEANAATVTSPDWALGSLPSIGFHLTQEYSYVDLKNYYFQSLTNRSDVQRAASVGLTFETLGHIAHHIQDMAAPQHVRNDVHLQLNTADTACASPLAVFYQTWCQIYLRLRAPSTYESWTTTVQGTQGYTLPITGYGPVYGPNSDGLGTFVQPRDFWILNSKGIAEFTNRNFLSAGTMGISPPSLGTKFTMKVVDLCTGAIPPCQVDYDPDDFITFYPSSVDDQLRPLTGGPNPFAAADSIFNSDLSQYTPGHRVDFSVNRFTFAYDHLYLLPRAVGYSAGFINYFFRGDMQVDPPDDGVYAVVDHNACGNPCGFRRLKLKLTNLTPGLVGGAVVPGGEAMGAGTLWAVVKHHSNGCYQSNLSGEYGAPGFAGNSCRSTAEAIAVSQPVPVSGPVGVPSDRALDVTFNFDLQPIPINASDIYLQVIFRGKLGQEDDAIAVTTKDIAEPNFFALVNATDFIYDPVVGQYFALPYKGYTTAVDVSNIRVAFGANSAWTSTTALATLDRLGGGQHAQLALLMEPGRALISQEEAGPYTPPGEQQPFDVQEFTLDDTGPAAGAYTRTCPVTPLRGTYRQYGQFFAQQVVQHRGSSLAAMDATVMPFGTPAAVAADPSAPQRKAMVASCAPVPTTGLYNFTNVPNLIPTNAVTWQINF
jgi:hypothetical protein